MPVTNRSAALWISALAGAAMCPAALAQCPNLIWTGEFSTPERGLQAANGSLSSANALQVFDPDGPGPMPAELFVGGYFARAGGVLSPAVASWNGQRWADVRGGMGGTNPNVAGLGLHDPDGPGPQPPVLIAAGSFTSAGGVPAARVAAWDGASWSPLGSGFTSIFQQASIVDFDQDGPGPLPPALYVAASIELTAGTYTDLARWDGQQWSAVPGAPFQIYSLAVFDEDGPGPLAPALFAAVDYTPGVYRWNGVTWDAVGGGLSRSAEHRCAVLTVIDEDGPGPLRPALFAGGSFLLAGSTAANNVARWDGQQWTKVGEGVPGQVEDIATVDYTGGAGAPTIYATSVFNNGIYRWDPAPGAWKQIGLSNAAFGIFLLFRLAAFDEDGPGGNAPSLYHAAVGLSTMSGVPSRGVARYGCACYANCDGSTVAPALNVNDFICFMNRFVAGDPYANCDSSTIPPVLNVNDYICFQSRFAAGCP